MLGCSSDPIEGAPAPGPEGHNATVGAAETGEFKQLHPALRKVWMLSGLLWATLVAVIAGIIECVWRESETSWPLPAYSVAASLFVLLAAHALLFSTWRYRAWRYAIRPHDVLLHYGVLWRTRSCIPRLRIQHVDIESGPIDRAFGMVKLSLYTAGTASAVGAIPGLLPADAEALRETLLATDDSDG